MESNIQLLWLCETTWNAIFVAPFLPQIWNVETSNKASILVPTNPNVQIIKVGLVGCWSKLDNQGVTDIRAVENSEQIGGLNKYQQIWYKYLTNIKSISHKYQRKTNIRAVEKSEQIGGLIGFPASLLDEVLLPSAADQYNIYLTNIIGNKSFTFKRIHWLKKINAATQDRLYYQQNIYPLYCIQWCHSNKNDLLLRTGWYEVTKSCRWERVTSKPQCYFSAGQFFLIFQQISNKNQTNI